MYRNDILFFFTRHLGGDALKAGAKVRFFAHTAK